MMSIQEQGSLLILLFSFWLLLGTVLLWSIWFCQQWHGRGRWAGYLGWLPILLIVGAYAGAGISWRLPLALINGYHYNPNLQAPDPALVPRRPEVLVERQLAALVGKRGPAPLRPDSALEHYQIEAVRIDGWWRHWLVADIVTTLIFADGVTTSVTIPVEATSGNRLIILPFVEVNRDADVVWYAPNTPLAPLLRTPAPITPLQTSAPPVKLTRLSTIDTASVVQPVDKQRSFAAASDITNKGVLLLDVDLWAGESLVGTVMVRSTPTGETETLAQGWVSARGVFAPDGEQIAYVRSGQNQPMRLVVHTASGEEQVIGPVGWMNQHWVGNEQIAFGYAGQVYLYNLRSGEKQSLAPLVSQEWSAANFFQVAPDGKRVAYVDGEGRLLVKDFGLDQAYYIGWDVTELSWGAGMSWHPDSQQLLYTATNSTTLPDQPEVWLWDWGAFSATLLARLGDGFLGAHTVRIQLGKACWLDETTVLFVVSIVGEQDDVHLLAARTTDRRLWDVTPSDQKIFSGEVTCAKGHVAVNLDRTTLAVYRVEVTP